jgi:hypothetical protein
MDEEHFGLTTILSRAGEARRYYATRIDYYDVARVDHSGEVADKPVLQTTSDAVDDEEAARGALIERALSDGLWWIVVLEVAGASASHRTRHGRTMPVPLEALAS